MAQHLLWQWVAPDGPIPDSYTFYKGMAAGAELLYQAGITDLFFSDPEATPGSTYFGYITATTGGVESGPSNEATVHVPLPPGAEPLAETHLFSTGVLTVKLAGGQVVTLAVLQDVSFGATFSRHDLYETQQLSAFAIDTADHEGRWVIKAGNAAINATSLQLLIASVLTTSGGKGINTLSGKIAFPPLQVLLTLQDTHGNPVTVACPYAKAMGDQIAFKLTDFAVQNFELHAYPDSNNVVAVISYSN